MVTFVRDNFSFCRSSLFTSVTTNACGPNDQPTTSSAEVPPEASMEPEDFAAVLGASGNGGDQDREERGETPADTTMDEAAHAMSSFHECDAALSQPPALIAIPGASEKEVQVCCCHCGGTLATIASAAASETTGNDSLGMCMAAKLFLGPKGRLQLAVGFEDGSVLVLAVAEGSSSRVLARGKLHAEPIMALDVDLGGKTGVSGSAEDKLTSFSIDYAAGRIAESHSFALPAKRQGPGKTQGVGDVAVRPDGKILASAGWDGRIRLYRRSNGKALATLKYHSESAAAVAFGPRTYIMASGGRDGTVALWEIYTKTVQ